MLGVKHKVTDVLDYLMQTTEMLSEVHPLEPGESQKTAVHALPAARNSPFQNSAFAVHSPSIFACFLSS